MKDKELLFKEEFDWDRRITMNEENIKEHEAEVFCKGIFTGILLTLAIGMILTIVQML